MPTPFSAAGPTLRRAGARAASVVVRAEYYAALGVDKKASKKEIKSAYRQKARQFHPDVNKEAGAEEKFKEVSEAYEVLSDDEKRQIYDQYGKDGLKGGAGGFGGFGGFSNPEDIFNSIFGARAGPPRMLSCACWCVVAPVATAAVQPPSLTRDQMQLAVSTRVGVSIASALRQHCGSSQTRHAWAARACH